MSARISDTYTAVDKSKNTKSRNKASTQLPLDPDPVADLYSVVDKRNNAKPALTEDTYEVIPSQSVCYNPVAATTDESAALYYSASPATYSKLDQIQVPLGVVDNTFPKKQTLPVADSEHKEQDKKYNKNILPFCLLACFTVLIIAVLTAAVAVAVAFVLLAGLRSDLTAALKDYSSSSAIINENIHVPHVTNNLETQLNKLRIDISNFTATINHQVQYLNRNASSSIDDIDQQINVTCELLKNIQDSIALLTSSVDVLGGNFSEQLNDVSNTTTAMLKTLNNEILETIMNSSEISVTTINTLQDRLAKGIQNLHIFDSCEAVSNFSIQLPSGMYYIREGNFSREEYCFTSCNGIRGRWRRIAYLSNNISPVECPMGFQVITDLNVPALCKRNPTGARCSSIAYSTNGNSYSQVCGTIHGSYFGDPDGFDSHSSIRFRSADTPINGNYVDGISLTHGSMYEHHIWTLSAIVNFANPTDICSVCASNKPSYVGMDYSCDVVERCKVNCSPRQIWVSGQCIGNNTFYKNLMKPTIDDIQMRVCTDQAEGDEDIFLSFVELYVM